VKEINFDKQNLKIDGAVKNRTKKAKIKIKRQ